MKKFICLSAMLFFILTSKAQTRYNYWEYNYQSNLTSPRNLAYKPYKVNKVREATCLGFDKQNKSNHKVWQSEYSTLGVMQSSLRFNKKGKIRSGFNYHFIDSNHYDKYCYFHKKDTSYSLYDFDNKMNITKTSLYKKGKLNWFSDCKYNDAGKLISYKRFNKKNELKYSYIHEYYDNGSRKETKYYNKKGKLKHVWNYACFPEGELEKKIIQTNYCKKREYNPDSSYVEIYESNDNRGNMTRNVQRFTYDSLLTESTYFNKRGKEGMRNNYEYDVNRNCIKRIVFYKGKLYYTYYGGFLPGGLEASYKYVNAKGKENHGILEYAFY